MLSYYAYYTPQSISITAISTQIGFFDEYVAARLHKIRQVFYKEINLTTHLHLDAYGEYETWTLVIPDRREPGIEKECVRAIVALYTRLAGIYIDPMESLKERYDDTTIILEDR